MSAPGPYRITVLAGSPVRMDERLAQFFDYWRAIRGERAMPRRADIDPTAIPARLLPFLFLTDVVDGGARFRFRLVGTGIVAVIGKDATGRCVDEINQSAAYRDYLTGLYRRVVTDRRPVLSISEFLLPGDANAPRHATQRVMCPLSSDGATVDKVFACQIFELAPHTHEFPRLTADNPFVGICEAVLE